MSAAEGIELLSLINAWVKSLGSETFWSPSREGTENWGAVIFENGLTLLTPSTRDWIALLMEFTSFWMDDLTLPRVLWMKLEICKKSVRGMGG